MKKVAFFTILLCSKIIIYSQTPLADLVIESNVSLEQFGISSAIVGDLNGDGYDDVAVGTISSKVYVFNGSSSGLNTAPSIILNVVGTSISAAGDVNGDGFDDLIIGDSGFSNDQAFEGRVYIYLGSSTGVNAIPSVMMESNQSESLYGISVSGAGDVNNDGFDDVIVGAKTFSNLQVGEGRAFIYHGSPIGINPIAAITLECNQVNANLGGAVSGAGDVNNDGFDDILVGAPGYGNGQTGEGRVFIYHGSVSGVTDVVIATMESNQYYAAFGNAVTNAGDLNNDGYNDIAVAAYLYDNANANAGKVYIYYGSASGIITTPAATIEGAVTGEFGKSISSAGDMNNDGFIDLIVGASSSDNDLSDEGRSFIFFGSISGLVTTPARIMESDQTLSKFGISVSGNGDLDADGYSDLIVGANNFDNGETNEGRVFIYYGNDCISSVFYIDYDGDGFGNNLFSTVTCEMPTGYVNDTTDCNDNDAAQNPLTTWFLDSDGDHYYAGTGSPISQCEEPSIGYAFDGILGGGDCDDGDVAKYPGGLEQVDSLDNDCNGTIDEGIDLIYNVTLENNVPDSEFGKSLSNAGDVNGDGYSDIIVGAVTYSGGQLNEGSCYIYHGSPVGLINIPALALESNQISANFGSSVSNAGDVNGDGYDDVIIGANRYDNGESDEGRVFIYHGSSLGLNATPISIMESNQISAYFGDKVCSAGDVNGDGYDDVIVGAYGYDNGESNEGRAYIYHGSPTGINTTPVLIMESNQANAYFGSDVSGIGDVNNDGYDDVAIGAYAYDNGSTNEGRVYIYHGSATGINSIPSVILEMNVTYGYFGKSISKMVNLNGDAFGDIVVGSYGNNSAYIFYGSALTIDSTPIDSLTYDPPGTSFGISVANAGDVNGDGLFDLIVGASAYDNGQYWEGRMFLYNNTPVGISNEPNAIIESNQGFSRYGGAVSGAGDVDGDGYDDFIVGAYNYSRGQNDEGNVFVYLGNCNLSIYYVDADADGFGNSATTVEACSIPIGFVADDNDCDDSNSLIFPGGIETCNGFDDNCNGLIDDGITETISITAGGPISFCQGGSVLLTATYSGASVQWKKNGTNIPGATSATYNVTTKGNYSCVTTSVCGIAESTPIFVNVIKNPNASISAGGPTTFCAGGSVVLTEIAVAGCTYQWYKGASPIAGATSLTYTATTSGNYKCRVTKAATGCYKYSNAIAVSVPCKEGLPAGEVGEMMDNEILIYPNPANSNINIETSNNNFKEIVIYDAIGNVIISQSSSANITQIPIDMLSSGIYFIQVVDGEFSNMINFVKQ